MLTLSQGAISRIALNGDLISSARHSALQTESYVRSLFRFRRPLVLFEPGCGQVRSPYAVEPEPLILKGIGSRQDLFEPSALLDRIPVSALHIKTSRLAEVRSFPLSQEENAFLEKLTRPTPLPMVLWKRGLPPRHAGALIVALNLLGLFHEIWVPGDLPRVCSAARIMKKMSASCPDHELLGVDENATMEEVHRAFRKLSLELHPDRLVGLSKQETAKASAAFSDASAAYSRLKRSRRSKTVSRRDNTATRITRSTQVADQWSALLAEARESQRRGNLGRAQAFALKALALSPPMETKHQLLSILRAVA